MEKQSGTLSIVLRPKTLDEVIGGQSVVRAIRGQLASGRLPVAWMLSGGPGLGKSTLALIIAKTLQPDCGEVAERNASDLNGVEDARELVRIFESGSLNGGKRVVILDEAQRMTDAAQNVLLKAFEAPDSPTVWIVCTTEPHKILRPLRDRCLSFTLNGLSEPDIRKLVIRALEFVRKTDDGSLVKAILTASIDSPRVILQCVERFAAGMSPDEAVQCPDDINADFIGIARAAASGNWDKVRGLLSSVKPQDTLALRGVVAGYLKSVLMGAEAGHRADVYWTALKSLPHYGQAFQDGTTHALTVAWVFEVCRIMKEAREQKR